MKKIVFKICLLCMIAAMLMSGCGANDTLEAWNIEPWWKYDNISKAIKKAVGEEVYYGGRSKEVKDGVEYITYWYVLREEEDEKLLADMINAVNEEMEKQSEKGKLKHIILEISENMAGRGCYTPIAFFRNYDVTEKSIVDTKFSYANIKGSDVGTRNNADSRYDDIAMYISIEGIKSLRIKNKLARQAEEEGIDFYEIWPDLEYYEEF